MEGSEITRHRDDPTPAGESPWVGDYRPRTDIEVVEADPAWPRLADELMRRVQAALGVRVLGLQHVGSTAVPGLAAKPVIDLDLTVADAAAEAAYVPEMERAGFRLVIREPWWQEHRCLRSEAPACNLHVFGPGAPEPVRHRIFRDWLLSHPDDLAAYAATKRRAATDAVTAGEHVMEYNARKQAVIRDIYDRASSPHTRPQPRSSPVVEVRGSPATEPRDPAPDPRPQEPGGRGVREPCDRAARPPHPPTERPRGGSGGFAVTG